MLSFELRTARVLLPKGSAFNARASWEARDSVLLRLADDHGAEGYGEATPLPGFSLESVSLAYEQLTALPMDDLAAALDTRDPATLLRELALLLSGCCSSARFAVESAALQLLARKESTGVAELLTRLPALPDRARPAQEVNCCELVDLLRRDAPAEVEGKYQIAKAVREVDALTQARGRDAKSCVKAKIGRDIEAELHALEKHRTTRIRLDANGSLPPPRLEDLLQRYAGCLPEFVEEPVPLSALGAPRTLPVAIAFDESLLLRRQPQHAARLLGWLSSGRAAALVVKPMLLGGINEALELFGLGQQFGVPLVLSHLHDGSVAARIYMDLARVIGAQDLAMGLGPHASLQLWQEPPDRSIRGACE